MDLNDKSANGNTLTNNGATQSLTPPFGGANTTAVALASSGTQNLSVVDASSLKPTGNFTVEGWYIGTTAALQVLFQSYSQNTNIAGILWGITTGSVIFIDSGKNTGVVESTDYREIVGTVNVSDGTWRHLAVVYDGTNLGIYVNGVLDTQGTWNQGPAYAATNYVRIGCRNNTGTNINSLNGTMDEVRLWNTNRTADQLLNNKGVQLTGNEANLQAYWPFNTLRTTSGLQSKYW